MLEFVPHCTSERGSSHFGPLGKRERRKNVSLCRSWWGLRDWANQRRETLMSFQRCEHTGSLTGGATDCMFTHRSWDSHSLSASPLCWPIGERSLDTETYRVHYQVCWFILCHPDASKWHQLWILPNSYRITSAHPFSSTFLLSRKYVYSVICWSYSKCILNICNSCNNMLKQV